MRWLPAILITLLLTTDAAACGNCHASDSLLRSLLPADPAKYRVVYTGLKGLLMDEYVRLASGTWADVIETQYSSGAINEFTMWSNYQLLNDYRNDYSSNKHEDRRTEWWQYLVSWGPVTTHYAGPSGDLIDFGPIQVNNKFRLNLKSYETDLTRRWHYKFRPIIKVTTRLPLISAIGVGHVFTYSQRGKKLISVMFGFGVNFTRREAVAEVQVKLSAW